MKKSRFSEKQIVGILKGQETGLAVAELCRKHGISSPSFCKWKAEYGGLDVSEARKLKVLEYGKRRLETWRGSRRRCGPCPPRSTDDAGQTR